MEHVLQKMARQLDALDEASLSGLWDKYAAEVGVFEPTKRWQEAVLVLSFIQAKRWKNQLFKTQWAARTKLQPKETPAFRVPAFRLEPAKTDLPARMKKATVLPFRPETQGNAD